MAAVPSTIQQQPSLLTKLGTKYSVEPAKMLSTSKSTAFKGDVSNEQMMALLIVADQYDLNPWTKEIYAFPDKGGIVPVVGVDGWLRIINSHPQFDGMEFADGPADERSGLPQWIEITIYRKDRSHPTRVREYMAECRRETGPWKSHPRRMLRNKVIAQGGRVAFGFVGIYEPDEAERIVQARDITPKRPDSVAQLNRRIAAPTNVIDAETGEIDVPTFDQVEQAITQATHVDGLVYPRTLIERMPAGDDRDELVAMAQVREAELRAAPEEPES